VCTSAALKNLASSKTLWPPKGWQIEDARRRKANSNSLFMVPSFVPFHPFVWFDFQWGAAMQNNQVQYSTAIERASNRKIIRASQVLSAERDTCLIAPVFGFFDAELQMNFVEAEFAEDDIEESNQVANGDQQYSPASIAGLRMNEGFDAEGVEQNAINVLLAYSERWLTCCRPSDARWAILLVIFNDKKAQRIFRRTLKKKRR
jgi:hypothetical protein